jgi:hypothetical protein
VNLIMLGFTLSNAQRGGFGDRSLHCSLKDIESVLETRLKGKKHRLQSSLQALKAGAESTPAD